MKQSNEFLSRRHEFRKAVVGLCLLLCCLLSLPFFGCGVISAVRMTAEMTGFVKGMTAHLEEREAALKQAAGEPLTADQAELLTQLLRQEKGVDAVLSSRPYLDYLAAKFGTAYEDYPTYLVTVPTDEQTAATLSAMREILPPDTSETEIQISLDFYFKLAKLLVKEPGIASDSDEMEAFVEMHLIAPLMNIYPQKMTLPEMTQVMKISVVPNGMATMDTEVFRDIWLAQLAAHGSRDGLLRCAVLTPIEFALIRSFFQDTAAFESWIWLPPQDE